MQTEDAAKITFEVPSKKFLKVAEVQTDESPWLQYPESTSEDYECESKYLLGRKVGVKIICINEEGCTL